MGWDGMKRFVGMSDVLSLMMIVCVSACVCVCMVVTVLLSQASHTHLMHRLFRYLIITCAVPCYSYFLFFNCIDSVDVTADAVTCLPVC